MRKFLRNFFWSHGTLLGYLGSLSQRGRPEIFSKWVLINLSNPLRHPAPLVDPLLTKNLDMAGPWCAPPCPSFLPATSLIGYVTIKRIRPRIRVVLCHEGHSNSCHLGRIIDPLFEGVCKSMIQGNVLSHL